MFGFKTFATGWLLVSVALTWPATETKSVKATKLAEAKWLLYKDNGDRSYSLESEQDAWMDCPSIPAKGVWVAQWIRNGLKVAIAASVHPPTHLQKMGYQPVAYGDELYYSVTVPRHPEVSFWARFEIPPRAYYYFAAYSGENGGQTGCWVTETWEEACRKVGLVGKTSECPAVLS